MIKRWNDFKNFFLENRRHVSLCLHHLRQNIDQIGNPRARASGEGVWGVFDQDANLGWHLSLISNPQYLKNTCTNTTNDFAATTSVKAGARVSVSDSLWYEEQTNSSLKAKETEEDTKRGLLSLAALFKALVAAGKVAALGGISGAAVMV